MKKELLMTMVNLLLSLATKENFNSFADSLIDWAENWAEGDPSTDDDDKVIVQAVCAKLRVMLDVPDND